MNKKLWIIAGGVLTVAVVMASIGAIAVYAQNPTPAGPQGGSSNGPRGPYLGPTELAAAAQALGMSSTDLSLELQSGKTLSAIATEKGVSLQTVEQAIQTARDAQLTTQINQAVTAGKMTQARATWLLQGLNAGYLNEPSFFGFGFGGSGGSHIHTGGWQAQGTQRPTFTPPSGQGSGQGGSSNGSRGFHLGTTELAAAAKALGMTSTDLSSELQSGKTLSTIATEKGVDIKVVMQAIQAARPPMLGPTELAAAANALGMTTTDLSAELKSGKTLSDIATEKSANLQTVEQAIQTARDAQLTTQINQAVTAGKMTQAKATWLLQGLNAGYLNGPGFFGFGFGGSGGSHIHMGGWQGRPTPQSTP